ncbi:TonB-dependent receptor [Parafilimonas sp.]|uniref:TonB-dependent receptor n=1 Tax=Parafilimonas sp. TaxID=1969739 RepID=UPI0039E3D329
MSKPVLCFAITCLCAGYINAQQLSALAVKIADEQNLSLPGATIVIDDKLTGVSDNTGTASFPSLAAGNHNISVSYIGYGNYTSSFSVSKPSEELKIKLTSGVEELKEVVILGDHLKGQAKALNQQKNSDNITNIISADQVGRFPDANIGDALKRVPGITMQNDQGEARNIVVRGMGPDFNTVSLNGERLPSAEGDNRRVQMDLIPADMIQTIEVNKTLTANMDADAIGGSVNLVTRAAPNGLRISGTLAGGYNPIRETFTGTGSLIIGNRFFGDKLGAVLSTSYFNNKYGSDNIEASWAKDDNDKVFVDDNDVRVYEEWRVRRSASLALDYKINPVNTIYVTGMYNWRDDRENRFRLRHRYRGDEEDYADDLIYDAEGNITGYTNGEVIRQTKGGIDNNRNQNRRLEDQRVRSLGLSGDHLIGKLKADWGIQYARASEKRPNERYISMGLRDITVNQDISDETRPLLTDETALSDYTRLDELTEQFQDQYEEDINAKLGFSVPLSIISGQQGSLLFGGRLRHKFKKRNNSFFSYEPTDDNEANYDNITLLPLQNETSSSFYPGSKYVAGAFITPKYLGNVDLTNSNLYDQTDEPSEYLAANFTAKEVITAGYIELRQHFTNKFMADIGLRIEHTAIDYTGNIVEDEETLKGQVPYKNNYTTVLPDINLRYQVNSNFVLKGAWTNGIARPKYYDLVPYININPNDLELSSGNTTLEPVKSMNFDLMAENYFKSVGLVSGGLFYKKLNNFFYNYIDNNFTHDEFAALFPTVDNPITEGDNWDFTQPRNGDGATVWGAEIAIQRQLDFLGNFWKGFGVYLNYTYTHSNAKGIYNEGVLVRSNVKLPGAAPNMFNASLSYENKKLVVRVSANFTSAYVDDSEDGGYNEDAFFDRYYDKQFFLDANASYAFTPQLRIFAEANNLTNQPLRYYQGVKERTAQLEYYGPRFNLGLKFDLNK